MWLLCLIPILVFGAMALVSYRSGKELKEDISQQSREDKLK